MLTQLTRFASLLEVPLDSAEMEIRATFPQEGKYGLTDTVGSAMEQLTYVIDLKSPASPEKILQVLELTEKGCHAANSLRVPVEVVPLVRLNGEDLPFTPPPPPEMDRGR